MAIDKRTANVSNISVAFERTRILSAIDEQIRLTEDCPLYEGEERFWLLSAYRQVRRLVNSESIHSSSNDKCVNNSADSVDGMGY